jgi:hypothetical protein
MRSTIEVLGDLTSAKSEKSQLPFRVDCNLVGCVVQGTNLRSFEFLLQPLFRLEQPFGILLQKLTMLKSNF